MTYNKLPWTPESIQASWRGCLSSRPHNLSVPEQLAVIREHGNAAVENADAICQGVGDRELWASLVIGYLRARCADAWEAKRAAA